MVIGSSLTTVVSCIEACKTMMICVRRTNVLATPVHTAATVGTTVVLPVASWWVVDEVGAVLGLDLPASDL